MKLLILMVLFPLSAMARYEASPFGPYEGQYKYVSSYLDQYVARDCPFPGIFKNPKTIKIVAQNDVNHPHMIIFGSDAGEFKFVIYRNGWDYWSTVTNEGWSVRNYSDPKTHEQAQSAIYLEKQIGNKLYIHYQNFMITPYEGGFRIGLDDRYGEHSSNGDLRCRFDILAKKLK